MTNKKMIKQLKKIQKSLKKLEQSKNFKGLYLDSNYFIGIQINIDDSINSIKNSKIK